MSIPYLPTPISGVERFLKNDFTVAALVAIVATTLSFLVATWAGWITTLNGFEVGATALNYASFYLSVKRRRAFYLIGFAASALFIVTYLQVGLLASAALSAYLTIALFVGFYMWGKDSKPKLKVEHVQLKWLPVYAAVTLVAYGGAVLIFSLLGASFAPWDSVILISTLAAQFLLDRKKLENWWVWIIGVNLAGTVLYFTSGIYFAAIQQLIFGIASVWGWWEWQRTYNRQKSMDAHPAGKDMRLVPVNNPLNYRADGSIRPGDPAYDAMMEVLDSGTPAVFNQRKDGTWDQKEAKRSSKWNALG